jgi:hypothetical protein
MSPVNQVRLDEACSADGTHLTGAATLPDTLENLGVTERQRHLQMLARTDLRRVENGVDQPRPGPHRQVSGLNVEGCPNRSVHDLNVGSGHAPPVLILDNDPRPMTVSHR